MMVIHRCLYTRKRTLDLCNVRRPRSVGCCVIVYETTACKHRFMVRSASCVSSTALLLTSREGIPMIRQLGALCSHQYFKCCIAAVCTACLSMSPAVARAAGSSTAHDFLELELVVPSAPFLQTAVCGLCLNLQIGFKTVALSTTETTIE